MGNTTATRQAIGKVGTGQVIERFKIEELNFRQEKLPADEHLNVEIWELSTLSSQGTLKARYMSRDNCLSVYHLELESGSNGKELSARLIRESGIDRAMSYLAGRKSKGLETSKSLIQSKPWTAEIFGEPLESKLRKDEDRAPYFVK